MLGNFSFGEYFKEGATEYATEFMQERLKLDWDRVWISVHAGDPELKLGPDEEAIALWEQIGMPSERIVALPSSENFWSVGGPGPCGPDSEIYYDRGEELACGRPDCQPGCSCERFLEIWNLVFMTYELHPDGTLTALPEQNIDTGMGLERAATTLQDVISVYDTDGYRSIMDWIELQSTDGFPTELTVELARERGQAVNLEEFESEMDRHREVSRAGAAFEVKPLEGRTDFVGNERTEVLTAIVAYAEREDGLFDVK